MKEKDFWIALNLVPGLGKTLFYRLIKFFGAAENIFTAKEGDLRKVEGIGVGLAGEILRFDFLKKSEKEKKLAAASGADIVTFEEPEYPENLKGIYDPSPVLYIHGELLKGDVASIAVVGVRTPSHYGKLVAEKISGGLAKRGITVVSGMARGIDSIAHKGALDNGGRTIAVFGSGLNVVYPPENLKLRNRIREQGAIISEFSMSQKPERGNFPARNRIVSGLSLGTLVVEAGEKSGALITANFALDQGREVFAVPGNVNSPKSKGANRLIKKGAKLVENVEDIIEEIPLYIRETFIKEEAPSKKATLTIDEGSILSIIEPGASHIDSIIERSGLSSSKVSALLLSLELNGVVKQMPGKMFVVY